MRNHFDNVNGSIAISYLGATVAGWTISEWASLAALVSSLIWIGQKAYQLVQWLRTRGE